MIGRAAPERVVEPELDRLLSVAAAVLLAGPPATGKTTIARQRASVVVGLPEAGATAGATADWTRALGGRSPVLVDDWHRHPGALEAGAAAVRDAPRPGRFLLTGATPELPAGPGIALVRVRPLSLAERGLAVPVVSLASLLRGDRPELDRRCPLTGDRYLGEVLASGLPGIRPLEEPARRRALDRYLERLVAAVPAELGRPVRDPGSLRRRLAAYAAATATTVPESTIAEVADQHRPVRLPPDAAAAYRRLLERLGIVDDLPAFAPRRRLGRLAEEPKRHLADPALAARLLGLDPALLRRSGVGADVRASLRCFGLAPAHLPEPPSARPDRRGRARRAGRVRRAAHDRRRRAGRRSPPVAAPAARRRVGRGSGAQRRRALLPQTRRLRSGAGCTPGPVIADLRWPPRPAQAPSVPPHDDTALPDAAGRRTRRPGGGHRRDHPRCAAGRSGVGGRTPPRHPQDPPRHHRDAREPLVRQLLRDVSGGRRHPDARRRSHRLRPQPAHLGLRRPVPRRERRERRRSARPPERGRRHRRRQDGWVHRVRRAGVTGLHQPRQSGVLSLQDPGARRDGLPHQQRDPQLLDVRPRLRPPGPHVRT